MVKWHGSTSSRRLAQGVADVEFAPVERRDSPMSVKLRRRGLIDRETRPSSDDDDGHLRKIPWRIGGIS